MKPAEMRRLTRLLNQALSELRLLRAGVDSIDCLLGSPPHEHKDSVFADTPADDQRSNPRPLATIRVITQPSDAELQQRNANQQGADRFQRRSLIVQWSLFLATLSAFGAAAYYAHIAEEQTTLLRQQLIGSQGATVTLTLSLYPNNMLSVNFDQRGTVAAKNVCLAFQAVRKTIPDLTNIEPPISGTACEPVLSDRVARAPQEFALPGLTPAAMEEIRKTQQTVMVTGEFSYDNGFGDVARESVCQYWLSGIPDKTVPEGGANEFVTCGEFPARLNNVLKARNEAEAAKR